MKRNLLILFSHVFFLAGLVLLSSCVIDKGTVRVSLNRKTAASKSITSVAVVNNQIKITGTGLSGVTSLKIKNVNLDESFTIESASATQIIANATRAIAIGVGQTFDLILNSAEGAATFPVSFTIDNGTITASMLSTSGVNSGEILKFNGTSWVHVPLTASQLYIGGWDAASDTPALVRQAVPTAGDYYIVTAGGTKNLGSGNITYAVGDIIISNGASWDLISGAANAVLKAGDTMSGVLTLDSDLKIKSSSNSNYVTIKGPALASSYNLTLPTTAGTAGFVLSTNGAGVTSWVSAGGVGTVTNVTSANTDIGITAGTSVPVLTLNSGTAAGQVVKLNGSAQLPAVDGSLLTSLNPANFSAAVPVTKGGTGLAVGTSGGVPYFNSTTTMATSALLGLNGVVLGGGAGAAPFTTTAGTANQVLRIPGAGGAPAFGAIDLTSASAVTGALPIANGGTGATTLGAAQSALGISVGGATTGSAILAGVGGVIADKICAGDTSGGGVSCTNLTSSFVAGSITDESGTGALLFGSAPTITNPVIANLNPGANFTLTQNSVVPFASENAGAVANTLYLKAGQVGIGTTSPGSTLDVKGTLRLSGSTSGYVGFAPAAAAGSTTYTLPAADGTNGQVLTTNASGVLSWTTVAAGGAGTVTDVTSANTDIGITSGTSVPVLTLNSGTGNNQIVKLNGTAQLPAVDGSLLTSLNPANLSGAVSVSKGGTGLTAGTSGGVPYFNSTSTMATSALLGLNGVVLGGGAGAAPFTTTAGTANQVLRIPGAGGAPAFGAIDLTSASAVTGALPIANGGTGATTLGAAQSALGITLGGATTGAAAIVGTGGVVANKICSGDSSGGGVSCVNTTSLFLASSITDESGTGALLFGSAPTITNPVITNLNPGADFTITQNTVIPFASENTGAVVNTLYLKTGLVGIGTNAPRAALDVSGTIIGKASVLNGSTTIDFSTGNTQHTAASCGAFTLNNMKDGGSYIFIVKGATSATCSFTAWTGSGSGSLTVHMPPGHTASTVSTHTMYNFLVSGSDLYVSWIPGY